MKVSIAAQTFSASVADALTFLEKELQLSDFKFAEETANFTQIINNLFDICNSRSLVSENDFKKALSPNNAEEIFKYFTQCSQYICHLSADGQLVLTSRIKTGFLGFLISMNSFKCLYNYYALEKGLIKYLLTYKFSQVNSEILFSVIRSKGGSNNNPTAKQFQTIYK